MDDRRDPKADGEPASKRDEVIESRNAATSAVLDLRRELLRLTDRAQEVEGSLSVERRQRGNAEADVEAHKLRELAAEERAKEADERARAAEERTKIAEVRAKTSEGRSRTAEDRAKMTEDRANAAIDRAKKAEERAKASEEQAKAAEENARLAEEQAKEAEADAKSSQDRAKAAEERAKIAEARAQTSEERTKASEERAKAMEERAKASEDRAKASEDRAKAAEDRARATDVLARAAEAFAKEAEERAKLAEAQAAAEKERADASEAAEVAIGRNLLELHAQVKTAFSRIPSFAPPPPNATESAVERLGIDNIPAPAAMPRMSPPRPASNAPSEPPALASYPPSYPPQPSHPSHPPSQAPAKEPDPFPSIRPAPPAIYSSPPAMRVSSPAAMRVNPPDATPAAPGVQQVARAVTPGPPPVVRSVPELTSLDDEWSKPMLLDMPLPVRQERDAMLLELRTPQKSATALGTLLSRDWLRGLPPESLVMDLAEIDYDADSAVFEVARSWERGVMSQSVVVSLQAETDPKRREHAAWLVQHLGGAADCQAICEIAEKSNEGAATRVWLLKALARLVTAQSIGWKELLAPLTIIAFDADATVRDAAAAVIDALPKGDEKRRLLLEILRKDNDENVLSRAIQAIGGTLPIEIGTTLAERLLGHPSPRVQEAVRALIALARARRAQSLPPPAPVPTKGSLPPGSSSST